MERLVIDFSDRDDIRAKLPAACKRLNELEEGLRVHTQEVEDWREIVSVLTRRAELPAPNGTVEHAPEKGEADSRSTGSRGAQPLDLVVEVVNRERREIRAKDVRDILREEGHDLSSDAVSNALFYAAKRAKPPRLKQAPGRGFYAPLDLETAPPLDPDGRQVRGAWGRGPAREGDQ